MTGSGCRTTPWTATSTSGRWPPAATSAGWPGRRRRRCGCWTPPAATSCWSRRSASGSPRSRWPGWPTPPWCCWRPGWATGSRPPRPASSRSATSSSSTRPTATAPTRPSASSGTCSRSGERRGARATGGRRSSRPSPRRGEGVDEVVEALDKHRAWLEETGALHERRLHRAADEVEAIALTALRERVGDLRARGGDDGLDALAADVVGGSHRPVRRRRPAAGRPHQQLAG